MRMTNAKSYQTGPVWTWWSHHMPAKPFATDDFEQGVFRRPKDEAMSKAFIEYNSFGRTAWFVYDIDRADAHEAWEVAGLPPPNIFIQNPKNFHGHLAYALRVPVGLVGLSREAPIRFAADVQRGMTLRLRADRGFINRFAKNPIHPRWRTSFIAPRAFSLAELRDHLDDEDVIRIPGLRHAIGLGRNCELFDTVRYYAYSEVLGAKASGEGFDAWHAHLRRHAASQNQAFPSPLGVSETRHIAKSVAQWTWRHFNDVGLSKRQSIRGQLGAERRWEGHEALAVTEPWKAEGISRATWYRRGNAARTPDVAE